MQSLKNKGERIFPVILIVLVICNLLSIIFNASCAISGNQTQLNIEQSIPGYYSLYNQFIPETNEISLKNTPLLEAMVSANRVIEEEIQYVQLRKIEEKNWKTGIVNKWEQVLLERDYEEDEAEEIAKTQTGWVDESETEKINDYFERAYKLVIDIGIDETLTQKEAWEKIFNYIANTVTYDAESIGWVDVMDRHVGNCNAISEMAKVMCYICGIECYEVTGYVNSKDCYHGWNFVKLDGIWYYSDITFYNSTRELKYFLTTRLWNQYALKGCWAWLPVPTYLYKNDE